MFTLACRTGAVWCEKNCTDRTGAKKIAPTTPVRCAQLKAHWCDGRGIVEELLYMALIIICLVLYFVINK